MTATANTTVHAGGVAEHVENFVRTFNSGDFDATNALYAEDAISVWEPGNPLSGQARKDALAEFIAIRPVLSAKIRESYVTNDTALLITDWTLDVPNESGGVDHIEGIGTDVMRRDPAGKWRYVVDEPYGDPRNK
ncbi:YybH family protein [Streptomyces sp. NPDC048350]|uniref:YybH family protein n=1 Tax=Streptomyces sp. NPDC048350 TaxID=3365538 RepID=UPI00371E6103